MVFSSRMFTTVCHDMLVFLRFYHSHHKSAEVSRAKKKTRRNHLSTTGSVGPVGALVSDCRVYHRTNETSPYGEQSHFHKDQPNFFHEMNLDVNTVFDTDLSGGLRQFDRHGSDTRLAASCKATLHFACTGIDTNRIPTTLRSHFPRCPIQAGLDDLLRSDGDVRTRNLRGRDRRKVRDGKWTV